MNKEFIQKKDSYESPRLNVVNVEVQRFIATSLESASLGSDATFGEESDF